MGQTGQDLLKSSPWDVTHSQFYPGPFLQTIMFVILAGPLSIYRPSPESFISWTKRLAWLRPIALNQSKIQPYTTRLGSFLGWSSPINPYTLLHLRLNNTYYFHIQLSIFVAGVQTILMDADKDHTRVSICQKPSQNWAEIGQCLGPIGCAWAFFFRAHS